MSKTVRRKEKDRGSFGYLIISYLTVFLGISVWHEGRLPLYWQFYARTLLIALGIMVAVIIAISVFRRHKLAGASMKKIDSMSGEDFEQYLGILYKRKGYKVSFTPGTMDFGADLIIEKGSRRTVVQAKRYRNMVGEASIQQALSGMGYYKADDCMVVTNSRFTAAAKELASKTGVRLIDRKLLGTGRMYP